MGLKDSSSGYRETKVYYDSIRNKNANKNLKSK